MSIGASGIIASTAGSALPQTKGSAVDRAHGEVGAERRQVYHEQEAMAAAGVGEPDGENHETAERDADGRRPWDDAPEGKRCEIPLDGRQSKDSLRQRGNLLDVTG